MRKVPLNGADSIIVSMLSGMVRFGRILSFCGLAVISVGQYSSLAAALQSRWTEYKLSNFWPAECLMNESSL